jgi:hypothetical protein
MLSKQKGCAHLNDNVSLLYLTYTMTCHAISAIQPFTVPPLHLSNMQYVYPAKWLHLANKIQIMQADVTTYSQYSYLFESKLSPKRMLSLKVALRIQGSWLTYAQEPSLVTWPEDRCSCPKTARSKAVLPDPTWPQTAISCPYTIHTSIL